MSSHAEVAAALSRARTQAGDSVLDLSEATPLLVVCLRHFGCTFCREALDDLGRRRADIERSGARIVVVHMSRARTAEAFLDRYGLDDVIAIADPDRHLYRALELRRGSLRQLFAPRVWWRGVRASLRGHLPGLLRGDGLQMPGAFLIHRGEVVRAFRHATAAERPDYCELAAT